MAISVGVITHVFYALDFRRYGFRHGFALQSPLAEELHRPAADDDVLILTTPPRL